MGIIKTAAKVVGTVALVATGVSSEVLNVAFTAVGADAVIDKNGGDPSSTIFVKIRDGSFDTIHKMWNPDKYKTTEMTGENEGNRISRQIASKWRAIEEIDKIIAAADKRTKDTPENREKIEELKNRREYIREEIRSLQSQL